MGRFIKNFVLGPTGSYSVVIPGDVTALRPAYPVEGQFRYNSSSTPPSLEAYVNGVWRQLSAVGNVTILKDTGTGDGTATVFPMPVYGSSYNSGQEPQVLVFIGGVFQNPGVNYTFNGTNNITFLSPVPFGQIWVVLHNFASNLVS
jgi:hypothetical protein